VGIPVMGHIGLTPQAVHRLGFRKQGLDEAAATEIFKQAQALVEAGVFALLLEHMPAALAAKITQAIPYPRSALVRVMVVMVKFSYT
jgi:3-methyl-2-oxobutanoate hydroxymethyltransferase